MPHKYQYQDNPKKEAPPKLYGVASYKNTT